MGAPLPDLGPFTELDAGDGFHTQLVEAGGEISLHVCAYAKGRVVNLFGTEPAYATVEVATWRRDERSRGAADRLSQVLEGVCRYLNTGGSWAELQDVLQRSKSVARGGMFYDGYSYHSGGVTEAGAQQHIFVRDDGKDPAIVWVEGSFIDAIATAELEEVDELKKL